MGIQGGDYHALLARHDAMRLRQQMLSPREVRPAGGGGERVPYDGAADWAVIADSLDLVTPFDELISLLYEALFRRHPYLRSLFPEAMEFQRGHLARIFWYLIEHLDRPDEIAAAFVELGRGHRKLGVRPVHYEVFEEALREALRRQAGERWTGSMEQAWVRMLRFAVAAMVEGAESALTEPPSWQATVVGHQLHTPDLAVLRVQPHEPFPYRAGQYASVESPLLRHTWRPYHLARAPHPDGELEFHVRRTGPGGVSEALVHRTRVGDVLSLGPAHGAMTLEDGPVGDLLLVAAGMGWAPMKALLEDVEARRSGRGRVSLYLGARTLDELYDTGYLSGIERRRPWLRVVPVIGEGPGAAGYGSVAEEVVRQGDWSGHLCFVGGPPETVRATVAALVGAGVPVGRVRHDPLPAGAGHGGPLGLPRAAGVPAGA